MNQDGNNNYKPSELPFLIRQYIYPEFCREGIHDVTFQQFCDVLDGIDTSDVAHRITERLERKVTYIKDYKTCATGSWYMIPPKSFDIIKDELTGIDDMNNLQSKEHHCGVCQFEGQSFSFEYDVIRSKRFPNSVKLDKATVVCEGHSFEKKASYLHMACQEYFSSEAAYISEQTRQREEADKEKRWEEFRDQHVQELKEWFVPIIENSKAHICEMVRLSVIGCYLSYSRASQLDRGECLGCTAHCRFKKEVLPYGSHSQKWVDMGIDEYVLSQQ